MNLPFKITTNFARDSKQVLFDLRTLTYNRIYKVFDKKMLLFYFDDYSKRRFVLERITYDWSDGSMELKRFELAPEKLKKLREIIVERIPIKTLRKKKKVIRSKDNLGSVRKKNGPEILRHSYMRHLLMNGAPIQAIAQLVGHKSARSTLKYAEPLTRERIKLEHSNCHPRA